MSNSAEGRGGRRRGQGEGRGGVWGRAPTIYAPRRLSTSPLPPSPSQGGKTALDMAKMREEEDKEAAAAQNLEYESTEVVKLLEEAIAAQVGRAALVWVYPPPHKLSLRLVQLAAGV